MEALRWRRIPRNPAAKKPDSAMVIVDGSGVTIPFGPKSAEVEVPAVPKAGPVPNANCTPEKLPSDRTVLVVGHGPPLAAGPHDVQQGVDDLTPLVLGGPPAGLGGGDEAGDLGPLGPGQVGRVGFACVHAPRLGHPF